MPSFFMSNYMTEVFAEFRKIKKIYILLKFEKVAARVHKNEGCSLLKMSWFRLQSIILAFFQFETVYEKWGTCSQELKVNLTVLTSTSDDEGISDRRVSGCVRCSQTWTKMASNLCECAPVSEETLEYAATLVCDNKYRFYAVKGAWWVAFHTCVNSRHSDGRSGGSSKSSLSSNQPSERVWSVWFWCLLEVLPTL